MAVINWLEEVKADAERITRRRLEDDGFDFHDAKEKAINADELNFDGGLKNIQATHGTGATDPTSESETKVSEEAGGEQAKVGAPKSAKK
jgi:hypothetical protein